MDEHEKAMYEKRTGTSPKKASTTTSFLKSYLDHNLFLLIGLISAAGLCLLLLVRFYLGNDTNSITNEVKGKRSMSYGPLTSAAMLSTKKAC